MGKQRFMNHQEKNNSIGRTDRRAFLGKTSAMAAAAGFTPYFFWNQPVFANRMKNDRPRVGCIGLGSMGTGDARDLNNHGDIVAVCDVDANHLSRAKEDDKIGKGVADAYTDYRRLLERDDIDVVSIVTPDHWHVKIALEAMESGKHIFCQKPLSLTLQENQMIRDACRKHPDLVFCIGTQQRSDRDRFLRAINMVRQGLLGKITKVTCGINGSPTGGPFPVEEPPAHLDWDRWLGPAPKVDYRERRCHYEYRWWYEYSGGKFTDWGAHHIDVALWAIDEIDEGRGPVSIDGTDSQHPVEFKDGYPVVDDSYNTSHDFSISCKFDSGVELIIDSRGDNGILFEGEKGRLFVNRGRISGKPVEENWDSDVFGEEQVLELYKGKPFEWHKNNFFRCIREGGLPVSDVYSHLQVMNVCHLAAVAARLKRSIRWNPLTEEIVGDTQAASLAHRDPRSGYEYPEI